MKHGTRAFSRGCLMAALAACLPLAGCVDGPPYLYGERITGQTFAPASETVGVHPSDAVLADPANPFADDPVFDETRWAIEASGDPVAAFYCWATLLAYRPGGEHQYYAALNLQRIFEAGRAATDDLDPVRRMAIDGYQAVLDHFPGSVTFDAGGTIAYGLATPAYRGIVALGGAPTGGWQLVATGDGGQVAVKTADPPPPAEEDE